MQSIAKASDDKNPIEQYERVKQRRKWNKNPEKAHDFFLPEMKDQWKIN